MAIKASSFLFGNILPKDFAHSFATWANQDSVGLSMFVECHAQHPKHGVLYSQDLRLVIGFLWEAHGIRHILQQIDILDQPRHLFFLERWSLRVIKKK
jgi:hypothetical protein